MTAQPLLERLVAQREFVLDNLEHRRGDLERYRFVMGAIPDRDVSQCSDFQRTFNGLYMVRRNAAWRLAFFNLLEASKTEAVEFPDLLSALYRATGRIEASFASKLLATIDPSQPIYDSIVRQNLRLPVRRGSAAVRMAMLCEDHATIGRAYAAIIDTPEFGQLKQAFDRRFPSYACFTDVKKLDFMIWQARDAVA